MVFKCYKNVSEKIGDIFAWYGRKISRHPWKVIIVCTIINSFLGIGFLRLELVNDTEKLYTPENSQAFQDREKAFNIFQNDNESDFYPQHSLNLGYYAAVIIKPRNAEVLSEDFMDEVKAIYQYVTNIAVTHSGEVIGYEDICEKRNSICFVSGGQFLQPPALNQVLLKNISYPDYNSIYLPPIFGNAKEEEGLLVDAEAYTLRFDFDGHNEYNRDRLTKWFEKFIERMDELTTNKTEIAYKHSFSLDEELNANLAGDVMLFSITFTMMCVYASLATVRGDCLSDRAMLGLGGVFATALAILGSFGLCTACGVKFVNIVGVVPFLVLSIGVDDMFILLSGMAEAIEHEKSIEERTASMMRTSGLGITITSLTDLIGFLVGSASIFPAVQYFCLYTGVSILFCYLNHVTFFTSCIVLDQRRIADQRHSKTCMPIKLTNELKMEGAGKARIYCCSGKIPRNREDVESVLESFPRKIFTWLSLCNPLKPFILLMLLGFWGLSIWGALFFKEGLLLENLVHTESYYYKHSVWNREFYDTEVVVTFVFDGHLNYTSAYVREEIQDVLNNARQNRYINKDFQLSWLQAYEAAPIFDTSTQEKFAQNLKTFLKSNSGKIFARDVVFNEDSPIDIQASRVYVRSIPTDDSESQANVMIETRDVAKNSSLSVFAYAPGFIFFEQFVSILPQTMQTLGVVAAAILLVTFVFMPHPFIVILVIVAVTSIMTGLIGFMYFWDLTLSSITMIHVIMSVGFSVDYSAHICHAFMIARGETRADKVRSAMNHAGGPVFSGAFSSFLGIIVLIFTSSYVFQSFFKVMLIVIITGIAHALLFLPVIMSLIGPLAPGSTRAVVSPNQSQTFPPGKFKIPRPKLSITSISSGDLKF